MSGEHRTFGWAPFWSKHEGRHRVPAQGPKQELIGESSTGGYARQSISWASASAGTVQERVVSFKIPVTMPEPGLMVFTFDALEEYVLDLLDDMGDVNDAHATMRRLIAAMEGGQEFDRLADRPRRTLDVMIGRA